MTNDPVSSRDLLKFADSDLIALSCTGDTKAFEGLLRRYQKIVYNVLYQMLNSHESAADLTQETFLRAFRSLSSFDKSKSLKPWLLKIATNCALNEIRDNKAHESLDNILKEDPAAEPESKDNVENSVDWRMSQAALNDALNMLPIRSKHIFLLRYQQDLSYEEISEVTGEPTTTIKSLLFRTREHLRNMLLKQSNSTITGDRS